MTRGGDSAARLTRYASEGRLSGFRTVCQPVFCGDSPLGLLFHVGRCESATRLSRIYR